MQVRSLGYRTDLALLAMSGSEIEDRGDHIVVRSPYNPSYWWGNFLLLDQVPPPGSSQQWLDRFRDAFPEAEHLTLGIDGTGGGVEELAWFAEQGFGTDAGAVMTASSVRQPPSSNTEAVYRPLSTDADWDQSVQLKTRCNDAQLEPVAYRRFAAAKVQADRGLVEAGRGAWFGAFLDGRLVSQMGLFAAGTGLARFQSVETDPDYRRRGLAGSLLYRCARYGLEELGASTLVMVADAGYHAIDLYRAAGFEATESQLHVERGPAGRA
ncbi:MAG: GNAT family N-acetyltransferase [Acidimicrobiales bacterium]